jgi:hypothetical protein
MVLDLRSIIPYREMAVGDERDSYVTDDNHYFIEDENNEVASNTTWGTDPPDGYYMGCVAEQTGGYYFVTTSSLYFSNCHGVDKNSTTYYMGDNAEAYEFDEIDNCPAPGGRYENDMQPGSADSSNYGAFTLYNYNNLVC